MKLVIFGLSVSSAWGNGHATLWRGLCRALAGEGHEVVFFERDTPYYAAHRDWHGAPGITLVLYRDWTQARATAERHLRDADAGMVTSYCPDGVAASDLVLQSGVPVRSFYDLDAPVTLARLEAGESVEYLPVQGLRGFDVVLSYTGGRTGDALRTQLGAERVVPIYGSVDPDAHRPMPPKEAYRGDLSYLGTFAADRQAALEQLFLEPARRLPGKRFVMGGAQYPDSFPWTPNLFFVQHVPPPEHPAFYNSSAWTLNVTRAAMAAMGYCPSGRLFEAAACGTPVLSDDWDGLDQFFRPGEEVIVVRCAEDVAGALGMSDEQRTRIARRARERTLDEHTAAHRARELVDALGGTPPEGCRGRNAA